MSFLFMNWCEIKTDFEDKYSIKFYFNNKEFFDGKFFAPELFKLQFNDNELINIKNIRGAFNHE